MARIDGVAAAAADAIMKSFFSAKGDLLTSTGSGATTTLGVGANDYVLTADSTAPSGMKWAAGGGGSLADTLSTGNLTGGTDITLTSGDAIRGADAAVASGNPGGHVLLIPGAGDGAGVAGAIVARSTGNTRGKEAVDLQQVATADTQVASGIRSTIGGGVSHTSSNYYTTVAGGYNNQATGWGSTVGGGGVNVSSHYYTVVAGGFVNEANNYYSIVSGGKYNTASGKYSIVSGGKSNTTSGNYSAVGGGKSNTADGYASFSTGIYNSASGEYSLAFGNNATASGKCSFALGESPTATADYSFSVGKSTDATGLYSLAFGKQNTASSYYSIAFGQSSTASSYYSMAFGRNAVADHEAQRAFAESFGAAGVRRTQVSEYIMGAKTTNAAQTKILTYNDGALTSASSTLVIPANSSWAFRALLVGYQIDGADDDAVRIEIEGLIKRDGSNNTALVGTPTVTRTHSEGDSVNWTAAAAADDTDETLELTVTQSAVAALEVRWTCYLTAVETSTQ